MMAATTDRFAPRSPVLGWSSFQGAGAAGMDGVDALPHRAFTTSGRAAIYHALRELDLPRGAVVLVPSYHCPTMVAPVLIAGLRCVFFGLRPDGLPMLETIERSVARTSRAIIVPHYFGLPRSLKEVREWCDTHGVALIEDCAHCYFGTAGDRPVGAWGDFCAASLSKFFPVPEAGLLGSARNGIARLPLSRAGWRAEVKGFVDVLERAAAHERLAGINAGVKLLLKLKNMRRPSATGQAGPPEATEARLMRECDMHRIDHAPVLASMLIKSIVPRRHIVTQRQRNFALYLEHFADAGPGARPLFDRLPADPVAPYVFPLWVEDPDPVYEALKAQHLPVFRWDRLWPGVPAMPGDVGRQWSHHILQLLCHQDLNADDIRRTSKTIKANLTTKAMPRFAEAVL